jgi:hypothetical protein
MFKRKIDKAAFDLLHDEVKKMYKEENGNYILQVEESELVRAKDREKERADSLQTKLDVAENARKEAEDKLADDEHLAARKTGDIKTIEKSWEKKVKAAEDKGKADVEAKDKQLQKVLVTEKATTIAAAIAGDNAHLLVPVIERRLKADTSGTEAITRVLDDKGEPSALTLDELQKEIVANPKFSAIVIASKGSGGATDTGNTTSRPSTVPKDKKFGDLSEKERTDWFKDNPKGFEAARQEYVASLRKV